MLLCATATPAIQERPLFSTSVELVVLHVTVTDKRGAHIGGLSRDAFRVLEEDRPQAIHFFTNDDAPVTVGLLIDSSGSMQANRELVISAATAFAEASNRQDEMFALAFNETVRRALPAGAPFTSDSGVLREALGRAVTARGRTGLYDAISEGLEYLGLGHHERKVLVLVSDGADNASKITWPDVLLKAQASNAVIYTVALLDPVERDANPKRLKQIAEASGGRAFSPENASQVADALKRIARDIRNTYTIGYAPTKGTAGGAYRGVRVVVDSPGGRRVEVRTRSGYLVRTPAAGSGT